MISLSFIVLDAPPPPHRVWSCDHQRFLVENGLCLPRLAPVWKGEPCTCDLSSRPFGACNNSLLGTWLSYPILTYRKVRLNYESRSRCWRVMSNTMRSWMNVKITDMFERWYPPHYVCKHSLGSSSRSIGVEVYVNRFNCAFTFTTGIGFW